jgi:DNA polymerase-3 subunit epsilon
MSGVVHSLSLERPLAVFDIESTGTTARADRIVEIAILKLLPGGQGSVHVFRVNPGVPIPEEAARVHGIRDADVAACPTFVQIVAELGALLEGCDLAGYNVLRFDIPMLVEEFARVGVPFRVDGRRVIDAQRIFHRREPRDLTAAVRFYCGGEHTDAHGAEADATATLRVLEGEFAKYPDLPRDMDALAAYCSPRRPEWVDDAGKLRWLNGEVVLNFGQRKGTPLRELIQRDPKYIRWMLTCDMPRSTQEIVRNAAEGRWPDPPAPATPDEDASAG